MSRFTARRSVTALVVPAVAAAGLLTASAAMAAPMPGGGGNVNASVTVAETLTFQFNGANSFSLAPGTTDKAAVAFTIGTNDPSGYNVSQAAPDLSNGAGGTIGVGNLSEVLNYTDAGHPGGATQPSVPLTNSPTLFVAPTVASQAAGDTYSQDWSSAAVLANQAPGNYTTTITYVAAANA
jgi:hypothetical protein